MKSLFITLVTCLTGPLVMAQHVYKSDVYKISFTSPELMDFFDDDSLAMVGWLGDHYTLYIQSVPIEQESKKFVKDLKYGATEIARDIEMKDITPIGKIPSIEDSYYVLGTYTGDEGTLPVYIGAILNQTTKMAHEVVLYCHNQNKAEGEQMMKSVKLLK